MLIDRQWGAACLIRHFSHEPGVVAAVGDSQQPRHRGNAPASTIRSHESVPLGGMAPVCRADQAAA